MTASVVNEDLSDAEWFGRPENAGRAYRVRPFRRSDAPGLHPKSTFPRGQEPVATVVGIGRFGPFVAALPTFYGAPAPTIQNSDAGAVALIESSRAARALHYRDF